MEAVNILSLENTVAPFTTIRNFEEKNELIFTRYLFSKVEVKISLFTSLLEHEFREALYWAYELFYSGFRDETMDFVMSIYNENYKNINDFDFDLFLNDNYNEWYNDKSKEWILGVIVWNIAIREYDINPFISKLHGYKMAHYENIINKQKKHIRITMLDISTYKTIDHIKDKAWCTVLKNAYKFKCRKEYNGLFSVSPNDITKQYRYD